MIAEAIVMLRERAGLSQVDLARRMGMKRSQLCVIEKGIVTPSAATVQRIATAFEMTREEFDDFVRQCDIPVELVPVRQACSAHVRERLEVSSAEADLSEREDARGIASATTLPFHHAYLSRPHAGEILASALRADLRVGMAAFADLAWTLEFANVRIHLLPLPKDVWSASWWNPVRETLTIALDANATPERQTYRLAYELGAACLFRSSGDRSVRETAREHRMLSEFAADFLMPAVTIADMVAKVGIRPDSWTLDQLLIFKAHFGVSAETFAFRLEELGLISKPLRHTFRTKLRAYYKSHPKSMEPAPCRGPLWCGARCEVLKERGQDE